MAGIIAYTGHRSADLVLLRGLRQLEYRGYDSIGIAVSANGSIDVRKCAGNLAELKKIVLDMTPLHGTFGVAHTRWGTHGCPTEINAHPHLDSSGRIALVHNGIIENYRALKIDLEARGVRFQSETDSEVLVQLIGCLYKGNLEEAVSEALPEVTGNYAIAVICSAESGKVVAARRGSPMILGVGDNETTVVSDLAAIVGYEGAVGVIRHLSDDEMVVVSGDQYQIISISGSNS